MERVETEPVIELTLGYDEAEAARVALTHYATLLGDVADAIENAQRDAQGEDE